MRSIQNKLPELKAFLYKVMI